MARDGEVKQRQYFCHHGDTICHPKSCKCNKTNCTEHLHAVLSTCRCNNNAIFSDRAIFKFPEVNINLAAARSLGSSCQTGKMAALLNSLFFVFKIVFVPKYRVIHYDYIAKWCSGNIMYTVCTLDIAL